MLSVCAVGREIVEVEKQAGSLVDMLPRAQQQVGSSLTTPMHTHNLHTRRLTDTATQPDTHAPV